jgi:hypothetical protein
MIMAHSATEKAHSLTNASWPVATERATDYSIITIQHNSQSYKDALIKNICNDTNYSYNAPTITCTQPTVTQQANNITPLAAAGVHKELRPAHGKSAVAEAATAEAITDEIKTPLAAVTSPASNLSTDTTTKTFDARPSRYKFPKFFLTAQSTTGNVTHTKMQSELPLTTSKIRKLAASLSPPPPPTKLTSKTAKNARGTVILTGKLAQPASTTSTLSKATLTAVMNDSINPQTYDTEITIKQSAIKKTY